MSQLLDQAFHLLQTASRLEEESESPVNHQSTTTDNNTKNFSTLAAVRKYNEACHLMKLHLKETKSKSSKKSRMLIMEKIVHYENHVAALMNNGNEEEERCVQQSPRSTLDYGDASAPMAPHSARGGGEREGTEGMNDDLNQSLKLCELRDPAPCPPPPAVYASPSSSISSNSSNSKSMSFANFDIPLHSRIYQWKKTDERVKNSGMDSSSSFERDADLSLSIAMDLDERGEKEKAVKKYAEAAEIYYTAASSSSSEGNNDSSNKCRLVRKLEGAVERLEQIKKRSTTI